MDFTCTPTGRIQVQSSQQGRASLTSCYKNLGKEGPTHILPFIKSCLPKPTFAAKVWLKRGNSSNFVVFASVCPSNVLRPTFAKTFGILETRLPAYVLAKRTLKGRRWVRPSPKIWPKRHYIERRFAEASTTSVHDWGTEKVHQLVQRANVLAPGLSPPRGPQKEFILLISLTRKEKRANR